MKNISYLLILFISFLVACNSTNNRFKPGESKISPIGLKDHRLIFYKLDDYAKIIINDSLVYDTSEDGLNPSDIVEVDLNKFLKDGKYNLLVEMYNAQCDDCIEGNSWEVNYEYYVNGELFDYIAEKSESDYLPVGLSFSKLYENISFSK